MSAEYNVLKTTGVTGEQTPSVIGKGEPISHPVNCRTECPYGRARAFCFPCMAKILADQKKRG